MAVDKNNNSSVSDGDIIGTHIQIAGAGPAGLAAAITLAKAGRKVILHEAKAGVGYRFKSDLQGIENWSTKRDALAVLNEQGISTNFDKIPGLQGTAFDAWGKAYEIRSREPLFYMVERGPRPGSLDTALLNQALELGVEVRFNSRLRQVNGQGILATGPGATDAMAVGFHFETDMENGFWVICDNKLAPKGYAYLLIMNGLGTVKSCIFSDFRKKKVYVQRTVAAFEKLVGLRMRNPRPHGGVGNFRIPGSAIHGRNYIAGEQAGFQDTLWGFGMRHAITSGVLAAQSVLQGADYNAQWQRAIGQQLLASVVNRTFYAHIPNWGYRWFLRYATHNGDAREFLHHFYKLSPLKRLALPWSKTQYKSQYKELECADESCNHVRCRCSRLAADDSV
ncbi:MAG TPA: FAD-binding protein [Gammaproteobacteria bacterium]|nr:FAD-binding protein [Gammaproteobacteria bacterium]